MKKIGNITSIILSLGLAIALVFMIFKPTSAPKPESVMKNLATPQSMPAPSPPIQQALRLAAITLPPPPQPAQPPTQASQLVKSLQPLPQPTPQVAEKKAPPTTQQISPLRSTVKAVVKPLKKPIATLKAKPIAPQKTTQPKPDRAPAKSLKTVELAPLKTTQVKAEINKDTNLADEDVQDVVEKPDVKASVQEEAPTPEIAVSQTGAESKTGRVLLKLLEHGTGPEIEIAWPEDGHSQTQLHDIFTQCFGMVTAVMDSQNRLYRKQDNRGQTWDINTDRYSGFVRQPVGRISAKTRTTAANIRRHHYISRNSQMVRIFPRQIDALLLGGLHRLIGPNYKSHRNIQARYQLQNGLVKIENLNVDGAPIDGAITLHIKPACQGGYAL